MFSSVFAGNTALFSEKGHTEKESVPYKMTIMIHSVNMIETQVCSSLRTPYKMGNPVCGHACPI